MRLRTALLLPMGLTTVEMFRAAGAIVHLWTIHAVDFLGVLTAIMMICVLIRDATR